MLKRFIFLPAILLSLSLALPSKAIAQAGIQTLPLEEVEPATSSAQEAPTDSLASPSAEITKKIQEEKDKDITDTGGKQKSKLAAYLDENPPKPLTWHNPLQHLLRKSIANGLPANITVLILLFPVIATIIAASRHVIGLKGFGIYIPAVLSVAFVSTGLGTGVAIFLSVLIAAVAVRKIIVKLQLPYLPRTALLLWGVSTVVLGLLVVAASLDVTALISVNIFPVLIIMLLVENFIETQLMSSQSQAIRLTLETTALALFCSLLIGAEPIQKLVILNPELTFISVIISNIAVGRYSGLRLLERLRFRSILE